MVEFKLKALREWRNFLRILAGVLLIVCLLGFWKFLGMDQKRPLPQDGGSRPRRRRLRCCSVKRCAG